MKSDIFLARWVSRADAPKATTIAVNMADLPAPFLPVMKLTRGVRLMANFSWFMKFSMRTLTMTPVGGKVGGNLVEKVV